MYSVISSSPLLQIEFRRLVTLGSSVPAAAAAATAAAASCCEQLRLSESVLGHLSVADPGLSRAAAVALSVRAAAVRRLAAIGAGGSAGTPPWRRDADLARGAAHSHAPALMAAMCMRHDCTLTPRDIRCIFARDILLFLSLKKFAEY